METEETGGGATVEMEETGGGATVEMEETLLPLHW
jgi:hypothetical protein